ncbi:hypothetical protein GCM10007160_28740 [Litchfieldella qijiaojingensis]|uniref:DUF4136 domain-containing protein n=1 Tax=Litchfieldella qijiaojingensis TaxID=980347 RepID=A0ABQ2Z1W8_9GAMM|nr:hypothetical protein [Halomonas qijiaojingensis]GGX99352.1 hypothetical protein GCM10007160_28740 [Halomonas qijiaojingensis]
MRLWVLSVALGLVGCASGPATLPSNLSTPVAECRWEQQLPGANANRRAVTALEAQGFTIRDTNSELGLVSAERIRQVPGYYGRYYDPWPFGWYGGYGLGFGRHRGSGVAIGYHHRLGGGYAQRQERVSVVADGEWVRVSQDVRVVDIDGVVREGRNASSAEFCRELRAAMETPGEEEM